MLRKLLYFSVCFVYLFYIEGSAWKNDRRPKLMGDRLSMAKVHPFKHPIKRKIVMYHNQFRARVVPRASNMLRMKWNKKAARAAQKWASECMFLTHDNLTGRYVDNYGSCGQNIFVATHLVPWLFAIKSWFLEKDNFTYGSKNNDILVVGHYTQMVWASTHQVGCGLTKCNRIGNKTGINYYNYVCNYCPIGNYGKKLGIPYRSGKPCRNCKSSCFRNKLCTNSCPFADNWSNCRELFMAHPTWLCHTESTLGQTRRKSCGATCKCKGKIHD
ncbi:PREDICTED: cysteine-rich secretory protein 1-like [Nicrophorus vespilloides]|uniref:Cysteine-rich secretory protein 1-like n=1 Tax=Nicrophorus vespilloides TaxID=110193 RepID=A0ABM1NG11_NICVS|nr:PREDICTED: cysteine-rich secretory protein 1-like [Nicrophorus vespilloides]